MVGDKLKEYTSDITTGTTILLDEDGLLRGAGSKQITITSSANPIIRVSSNVPGAMDKSAVIENIVLLGSNGTETAILLDGVYNCQIRNVAIKNAGVGIKLTAPANKWTEATHIEHVRMAWVNIGIQFVKGDGTGNFGFTHVDDVGISLKDSQYLRGINVGTNCTLHAPFIKANVWSTQKCDGMYVDGEIKAGLINLRHEHLLGHVEGTGVYLGSNATVIDNQKFFVATSHIPVSNAVYNPHDKTHDIANETYATTGYYVSSIDPNFNENVTAPTYIIGNTNNAQYAKIEALNYGQTGRVCGVMDTAQASGHIYLYGYSQSGYNSHLFVYTSDDKTNWDEVVLNKTITQSTPHWIDCGSAPNAFNYIIILVYNGGEAARLYVDSVAVTP